MLNVDSDQLNGLLLARGLLDRGRAAANGTGPGAMAAVVLADLAVETAAKAALGSAVEPEVKHPALMEALTKAAKEHQRGDEALPGVGGAGKLRKLRNGVQHDGNEPSSRDVERATVWTEEFVDGVATTFFSTSLGELSRAALITDLDVRESVSAAEALFQQEEFSEAGAQLAIAFEQAHAAFRDQEPWRRRLRVSKSKLEKMLADLVGPAPNSNRRGDFKKMLEAIPVKSTSNLAAGDIATSVFPKKAPNVKDLAGFLDDLLREVSRIDQRVEAFAVAGDPSELAWFRQRLPRPAGFAGDGRIEYRALPPDPPFTREDYVRALDFVVGAAVRWQQTPVVDDEPVDGFEGSRETAGDSELMSTSPPEG